MGLLQEYYSSSGQQSPYGSSNSGTGGGNGGGLLQQAGIKSVQQFTPQNAPSVQTVAQPQQNIFQQIGNKASQVIKGIEFHFVQPSQPNIQPQAAPAPQPSAGTRMVTTAPIVGKPVQLAQQPQQPSLLSEIGNSGAGQKIKGILSGASGIVGQAAQQFMQGMNTDPNHDLYPDITKVDPKTGDISLVKSGNAPLPYILGSSLQNPMIAGPELTAKQSIPAAKGILTFLGTQLVQTGLIKVLTGGKGSQLSDVIHSNNKDVNAIIDTADFIGLAALSAGIDTKSPKFFDAMTKDVVQKYDLPKTVVVDSQDLRTMNNPATNDFIKTLGLSGEDVKNIRKTATGGTNTQITIQTAQLPQLVDKPYWSTIKDAFHLSGTDRTVGQAPASKVETTSIAGLLKSGENTPQEVLNTVFENKLEKTPEGQAAIKAASEAQTSGKNLFIAKQEPNPIEKPSLPNEKPIVPAQTQNTDITAKGGKLTHFDTPEIIAARAENAAIKQTADINTPERQVLRQQITDKLYGNGAENKNKRIDIVTGSPASGKSSALVAPLAKQHGSLVIDADEAKALIPEFNGKNTGVVHNESSDIVEHGLLKKAVQNGDNIVMPMVGKNLGKMQDLIHELKTAGYDVNLHQNELPPEKAAARAAQRFQETGRFVDPNYVLNEVGLKPSQNYDILKTDEAISTYQKYSNDVNKGEAPKLLEQGTNNLSGQSERGIQNGQRLESVTGNQPQQSQELKTPSKIATSIQQKAIDQGLTQKFNGLAGYDKITIKDQAEKAAAVMQNIDQARAIIRGEQPLPEGLRGTALITAMEGYIKETGDPKLAYELANSPLVSGTSSSAQELRLAAEREPDSLTAKLQEIKQARIKVLEKKTGTTVNRVVKAEVNQIKSKIKPPDKNDWGTFIQSIQC